MTDKTVDLRDQIILVIQEDLTPHTIIQSCHTCHIAKRAGGQTFMSSGRITADIGRGKHMCQLRGTCNHRVVLLCRDLCHSTKSKGEEVSLDPLDHGLVLLGMGRNDHGGATVEIRFSGFIAPAFTACHGMAADKGKSVFLCQCAPFCTDRALDTAAIHDDASPSDMRCYILQHGPRSSWVQGKQDQIAHMRVRVSQGAVDRTAPQSCAHGIGIGIPSEDGIVCFFMNGFGQ